MTGVDKNKKNSSESITEEQHKELQKLLHETRNNVKNADNKQTLRTP